MRMYLKRSRKPEFSPCESRESATCENSSNTEFRCLHPGSPDDKRLLRLCLLFRTGSVNGVGAKDSSGSTASTNVDCSMPKSPWISPFPAVKTCQSVWSRLLKKGSQLVCALGALSSPELGGYKCAQNVRARNNTTSHEMGGVYLYLPDILLVESL